MKYTFILIDGSSEVVHDHLKFNAMQRACELFGYDKDEEFDDFLELLNFVVWVEDNSRYTQNYKEKTLDVVDLKKAKPPISVEQLTFNLFEHDTKNNHDYSLHHT